MPLHYYRALLFFSFFFLFIPISIPAAAAAAGSAAAIESLLNRVICRVCFQELDEKRIKNVRNYMLKSVEIERAVSPIIATCLDGIENAANEINEKEDSLMVIERYKSGFTPPGDFPFEDLSTVKMSLDAGDNRLPQPIMQPIQNHLTVKGTVSGGKMKKRVGLFGIFSSNKVRSLLASPLLFFTPPPAPFILQKFSYGAVSSFREGNRWNVSLLLTLIND